MSPPPCSSSGAQAQDKGPIKIGFSQSLTGFLSPNGKQALLGMEIWRDQTNTAGGLLGRKVELVYYDDKSTPSEVPGIYSKLLDADKVDLVVSGYATNEIAPAMPIVIRKGKTFISLFGLDVNDKFKYPKYFSILPTGQDTKGSFTKGFFDIAAAQKPKPKTVALSFADADFSQNACEGARANAKKHGFKVVYDKAYPPPPKTTDFAPIVRAIKAVNAGPRGGLRLSGRLARHRAGRARNRPQAENVRRRAGRPAGDVLQGQAEG